MNTIVKLGMVVLLGWGCFLLEPNLLAEPLKGKAGEYIRKLEDYEQGKLNDLKKELWAKRVQVVTALKQEMEKVTKKGDLEGALAIKGE
ncbi:MAG: hypothetical protein QM496_18855 [Verrucomicrobiota bacterium]